MCPNSIPELSPLIVQRADEILGVREPVGHQQGRLVSVKRAVQLISHIETEAQNHPHRPGSFWGSLELNFLVTHAEFVISHF